MQKKVIFDNAFLPYLLVLPQVAVTLVFFMWPASQAVYQSFLVEDAFGLSSEFVWFENFADLFTQSKYLRVIGNTVVFSLSVTALSMGSALILAVKANAVIRRGSAYKTLLIWPYAVAPALAGVLWMFLLNPTIGVIPFLLRYLDIHWNHYLNGAHAMILVIISAAWRQISYNFVFFLAGLQAIPKSLVEAAAIDGAGPIKRFWTVIFPLLSPTTFFLVIVNIVYAFFDTFGVIHATTAGGPAGSTEILVYKVFNDGFIGLDLGSSSAQSVILLIIVITLTVVQFKYVERRVAY